MAPARVSKCERENDCDETNKNVYYSGEMKNRSKYSFVLKQHARIKPKEFMALH